ncbi:hypothetical protein TRIUR3_02920 [Triticum urartu]|uniref:Uncharacterized protein n=1 Tax=Triticum urartu TaxID=4572 RepID=M8B4D3_TRIUA|nr:hypothetical protein TRIUR3_02920 [Triticum urartu]
MAAPPLSCGGTEQNQPPFYGKICAVEAAARDQREDSPQASAQSAGKMDPRTSGWAHRNSLVHKVRRFIRISGVAPKEQLAGNTLMDHELMPIILCRYSQIDMESDLEPPTSHRDNQIGNQPISSSVTLATRPSVPIKVAHGVMGDPIYDICILSTFSRTMPAYLARSENNIMIQIQKLISSALQWEFLWEFVFVADAVSAYVGWLVTLCHRHGRNDHVSDGPMRDI